MPEKRCLSCGIPKPYESFPSSIKPSSKMWRSPYCDECTHHKQQIQSKTRRRQAQLRKHGLTTEDYLAMRNTQEDCCAICGRHESVLPNLIGTWKRLVIDHDHSTGRIRGLLCNHCNRGLGSFYDSISSLRKAIKYLQKASGSTGPQHEQLPLLPAGYAAVVTHGTLRPTPRLAPPVSKQPKPSVREKPTKPPRTPQKQDDLPQPPEFYKRITRAVNAVRQAKKEKIT